MSRLWRTAGQAAMCALGLALGACGGGSDDTSGQAQVRLVNASPSYAALELQVDDVEVQGALAYGAVGDYATVDAGSVTTAIMTASNASALATTGLSLAKDERYTVVAYGWSGALKTAILTDDVDAADAGKARLAVFNTAADAGSLDVYLTGNDESVDDASAVAGSVAAGSLISHSTVTAGTYRLRVTGAGDKSDLRLDVGGLTLGSTQVATLIVTPGSGGVLVHALLLTQHGGVANHANTLARVRVVASVAGNGRVSARVGATALMTGGTSPAIGGYATVPAGPTTPAATINGATVVAPALALAAGSDTTLLVWGDGATPQWQVIDDDNRLPSSSSHAKLRLVHGVTGLDEALTLTADFSVIGGEVALGAASAYANVIAGSDLRLDVSSPLRVAPLYSVSDVKLASRGLYTVFVLGDATLPTAALRKER